MSDNEKKQYASADNKSDKQSQQQNTPDKGVKPLGDVVDKKTVPPIGIAG